MLSEFGNIDEPTVGDTILVSYLYRDTGIDVNENSIEVYNLKEAETESIPTNITRFFLENAPIVNYENEIPKLINNFTNFKKNFLKYSNNENGAEEAANIIIKT